MTEDIKKNSNYLRGNLKEDLKNQITGSLNSDNQQLIKFHGIYQQDDRDKRSERAAKKLEKAYSFMIRLRIPGGKITAKQWLGIDKVTNNNSLSNVIKITTRQTVQLHFILKSKLKPTVSLFDKYNLDSIAACGDVNRNVISTVFNGNVKLQNQLHNYAVKISEELLPKTNAYKEIWLDGEKISKEEEPIYGETYLPRKFKIALALPPYNDVDVYAHDIGLIAIEKNNEIIGFNIAIGGGMGMTHGNKDTYPRVGSLIGYVAKDKIIEVIKAIITTQRDHGNRTNRKQARLKYTIDRLGIDFIKKEIETRSNLTLEPTQKFKFLKREDDFGFSNDKNGKYNFSLFIENGRVLGNIRNFLNDVAKENLANFKFTNNQNIILTDIENKKKIENLIEKYQISNDQSIIRHASMACVAMNTCPLALAEGQRYLPELITKIENIAEKYKLDKESISIRMTGCPNGCARPYLAEIAFVGKSFGKYNMMIGGSAVGERLNKIYKESINEKEILFEIDKLFSEYSINKLLSESFGDFVNRRYFTS